MQNFKQIKMCQQKLCGSCYSAHCTEIKSFKSPLLQHFSKHFEYFMTFFCDFLAGGFMVVRPKIERATFFVVFHQLSIHVCVTANWLFVYKVILSP